MAAGELYLNGEYLALEDGRIRVEDRGFQLGDAVYEVVKVVHGHPVFLREHLARLQWSLEQVYMEGALTGHPLQEVALRLAGSSGFREGTLYVQVSRGPAPRDFALPEEERPTVVAYVHSASFPGDAAVRAGVSVYPVEDIRWARCHIKSTNLLPAVLARKEADAHGAQEALFVAGGWVREGASSNFFAVVDGELRTHPADARILDGITRSKIIALAEGAGVPVREEAVTTGELGRAEEAFLTSTVRDVMPVVRVGEDPVGDGTPGPHTLRLADGLRALVAREAGISPPEPLAGGTSS